MCLGWTHSRMSSELIHGHLHLPPNLTFPQAAQGLWPHAPPDVARCPEGAAPFETGTGIACIRLGRPGWLQATRRLHATYAIQSMGGDSCAVLSMLCSATALLGCIGLAWVTVQIRSWVLRSRKLLGIPMAKPHWLFGHLQVLKQPDHHLVMRRWAEELGGMFRMRLGPIQVPLALRSRDLAHSTIPAADNVWQSRVNMSLYPVCQVHTGQ